MSKKIAVLGAGESGVGAALLAKKLGYEVFVSDKSAIADNFRTELEAAEIPYESGEHTEGVIFAATEIVKSPGIPDKVALIQEAHRRGIPVISEIEFAARYTKAKVVGITGSNGKTTTTSLVYHLLKIGGLDVAVGGNIGKSFARLLVEEPEHAVYVLELSSFQLDGIMDFRPDIAILLNITPDHLDRYNYEMAKYVASKFRITMNQTVSDYFIFNTDNTEMQSFMNENEITAQKIGISTDLSGEGITVENAFYDLSKTALQGPHNFFNAACAVRTATLLGLDAEKIQKGLNSFINQPHRLEFVTEKKGVRYINDSKATNVDSVFWALKAMTRPTILVLGGLDKGNDYTQIADLVREKVKAIVCMGLDNSKILAFFADFGLKIIETTAAKEAVKVAADLSTEGDTVLLSPACASFDLFKNYEDRGTQFREAALELEA